MANILTIALNPAVDISSEAEAVRPTDKIRTSNERQDPGGGGVNVARVITTLGGDAEVLFLAGGEMGGLLDRLLGEEGIRRQMVPIAGHTRISYTVRELTSGLEYRFVSKGPGIGSDELQSCCAVVSAHKGDYVVASGSLPVGAPGDIYARMADLANARGARFVLDSSGPGLRETLERSRVHLVKPNLKELADFAGRPLTRADASEAAMEIVTRGSAQYVAVTMGEDGALLASAKGVLHLPAIRVTARSAVGAGDSFVGAMTWALSQGSPPEEAFRYGVAAGAAAVLTPGTRLCQRDDVFDLYRRQARD